MNEMQYRVIGRLLEKIPQNNAMSMYGDWIRKNFSSEVIALTATLTHNDLRILTVLAGQVFSVGKAADEIGLSQGGVSRRINIMTKKGLIKKYKSEKNKKVVYLKLTPSGYELVDFHNKLHNHIKEITLQKMKIFSEEEIQTVISFLKTILTTS
ncbi:MarR family winged helix-turn-helix transcriptional regulator [Liquorilactobacillus oeni]|uniref:Transcriptional regulator, MarR family n=1 Tax=Liquorilactobacillus oeni DSM 19972 TaxID=1423777 RepID=A0A0R1MB93_9LACO|nr:MarR family transcriptional regulator [Liquorilactobacillus oeni]KRL05169.1 transcriptional regulator, MarR family [Liquorilactobacillus oeni DSM 19972]